VKKGREMGSWDEEELRRDIWKEVREGGGNVMWDNELW
jgi:hypothetical protein